MGDREKGKGGDRGNGRLETGKGKDEQMGDVERGRWEGGLGEEDGRWGIRGESGEMRRRRR